jgi:hypothetical protein
MCLNPRVPGVPQVQLDWASRVSNAGLQAPKPLWEAGASGTTGFRAPQALASQAAPPAERPSTSGKAKRHSEAGPLAWGEKRPRVSTGTDDGMMLKALRAAIASNRPDAVRQILGDSLYEEIRKTILQQSEEHAHQVMGPLRSPVVPSGPLGSQGLVAAARGMMG